MCVLAEQKFEDCEHKWRHEEGSDNTRCYLCQRFPAKHLCHRCLKCNREICTYCLKGNFDAMTDIKEPKTSKRSNSSLELEVQKLHFKIEKLEHIIEKMVREHQKGT